jgi:hypothetical protein
MEFWRLASNHHIQRLENQMDEIFKFMGRCPVIGRHTDPGLAAVIGLLFGGIGLGIYFRSVLDFMVPVGIVIVLALVLGDVGFIGGALVAGFWGYFRSDESNARMGAAPTIKPA